MSKFFAFALLCILSAAFVKSEINKAEFVKEFMERTEACMNEKGASKGDIDDLIKKKPAASKEAKCMRACIMMKYNFMSADGKFNWAVGLEHAKQLADGNAELMKIAEAIMETCSKTDSPSDPCEAAEANGKCIHEQATAHGVANIDFSK